MLSFSLYNPALGKGNNRTSHAHNVHWAIYTLNQYRYDTVLQCSLLAVASLHIFLFILIGHYFLVSHPVAILPLRWGVLCSARMGEEEEKEEEEFRYECFGQSKLLYKEKECLIGSCYSLSCMSHTWENDCIWRANLLFSSSMFGSMTDLLDGIKDSQS